MVVMKLAATLIIVVLAGRWRGAESVKQDARRIGCFQDKVIRDLPDMQRLTGTTPRLCIEHCESKGYAYAGVQGSAWCLCGNSYGRYGKLNDSECSSKCTGDSEQTCGHNMKNEVHSTGLDPVRRIGCFRDFTIRDLPDMRILDIDLTPQLCIEHCKSEGYPYAGVQFIFWCSCGNSYGRWGKLNDSECDIVCAGDTNQTCGAEMKNEVYSTGLDLVRRIGCFRDKVIRDLPDMLNLNRNEPQPCIQHCKSRGYAYAGVQDSAWCLCGNSYGRYGKLNDSECSSKCTGDSEQTCGHNMKNEVYSTGLDPVRRLGCFKDKASRDLPDMQRFNGITPQLCTLHCKSEGYAYAGVQYLGWCSCGNSYGRWGKLNDSECSSQCRRDSQQTCGHSMKNEVYTTGLDPVRRLGCFKDKATRDLPDMQRLNGNTPQLCIEHCESKGYAYAGVQSSAWCLCGNSYGLWGKLNDSECSSKCSGDSKQTCGHSMKNEVYSTGLNSREGRLEHCNST